MGAALTVTGEESLRRIERLIGRVAFPRFDDMLDAIGSQVVDQAQVRIANTKRAPSDEPWKPWSPEYALTRHRGHSLLRDEGHLLESIQHIVSVGGGLGQVDIGSNLDYAGPNQATRPYLGLSLQDAKDLEDEVRDWVGKLFR